MIKTICDDYTKKAHEGEIQIAIEHLSHDGYDVVDVRRIARMFLLFGMNQTEIWYTKKLLFRQKPLVSKTHVFAQEEIVTILWDFATAQQQFATVANKGNALICTNQAGTRVYLDALGKALKDIMNQFGYEVGEIE